MNMLQKWYNAKKEKKKGKVKGLLAEVVFTGSNSLFETPNKNVEEL